VQSQNILLAKEAEPAAKKNVHIILPPPKIVPLHDVFADAMLEKTFSHHRHSTKEPAANAGAHFILPPPKAEQLHEVLAEVMLENNSAHHWRGPANLAADASAPIILPPPKVEPLHELFAEAMLEDTSPHQRRSGFDWVASIGLHFAILAVLLILPLYFTTGLDSQKLNLTFLAPPVMPAAAPPPAPLRASAARPTRILPVRVFTPGQLTAPSFIPKAIVSTPGSAGAPPDEAMTGVPGGIPGGQVGGVLGGVLGGAMKGVPPPAPPVAAGPKEPVRVGGEVKPPRLLFAPELEYPSLAKMSRLSGVVVIEAIIDEHGNVRGMRVVSGHPLLIPAALSAVSKRRYDPTILDGEPTPIDLRVEIKFSFS
jgi:protein TonB